MIRKGVVGLGVALAAFAVIGLRVDSGATILWFDLVAAVLSVGIAGLEHEEEMGASRALAPVLVGLGLAAVWIGGLAAGQPRWAAWGNFVAAAAYLGLAAASVARMGEALPAARGLRARVPRPRRRSGTR